MNFIDEFISHEVDVHTERLIAQQIIAARFRKWNRKRKLVLKWSHYLRGENFATVAAIKLRKAAKLIEEAAPFANKLKYPSSFLLSPSQLTELQSYESVFVENHDLNSLSESVASSLLREHVRVGRAIGDMHRDTLIAHADLSRALTVERSSITMQC